MMLLCSVKAMTLTTMDGDWFQKLHFIVMCMRLQHEIPASAYVVTC